MEMGRVMLSLGLKGSSTDIATGKARANSIDKTTRGIMV